MPYWQQYMNIMIGAVQRMMEREGESIEKLAKVIYGSMQRNGVLHLFGTGHSHAIAEEGFHRSGGLAPVNPLLDPSLMLHEGVKMSSALERLEGYATHYVVPKYDLRPDDVVIVFSTSGRNPAPIEVAMAAREKGLFTACVSSMNAVRGSPSRHSSGRHLPDVVDLVIDYDLPVGDVVLPLEKQPTLGSTGGGSTILGMTLLNAVLCQVVEHFIDAGETPPLLRCPNVGDAGVAAQWNTELMAHYKDRLVHL
jgi:uncharacterized phosphosugar-binding protein